MRKGDFPQVFSSAIAISHIEAGADAKFRLTVFPKSVSKLFLPVSALRRVS
jgi:hypothetical protein